MVPPQSSILIVFSIINHPCWGTPIFGNPHINTRFPAWLPWGGRYCRLHGSLESTRTTTSQCLGWLPASHLQIWCFKHVKHLLPKGGFHGDWSPKNTSKICIASSLKKLASTVFVGSAIQTYFEVKHVKLILNKIQFYEIPIIIPSTVSLLQHEGLIHFWIVWVYIVHNLLYLCLSKSRWIERTKKEPSILAIHRFLCDFTFLNNQYDSPSVRVLIPCIRDGSSHL